MKKHGLTIISTLGFLILLTSPLFSGGRQNHDHRSHALENLRIEDPWIRPAPQAGGTSAGYAQITNSGTSPDRLIHVHTTISSMVELHTHIMEGGLARMRQVDGIDLAPGTTTELKPGGLHIMFMGLSAPLSDGDEVELTLVFEQAGEITMTVPVRNPPDRQGHHH